MEFFKFMIILFIFMKFQLICSLQILNSATVNRNNTNNYNAAGTYRRYAQKRFNINKPVRCELPILKNGDVKLRLRGKIIRFVCDETFILIGNKYAACRTNGKWDIDIPVCAKEGCPLTLQSPDNGLITYEHQNSSAHLHCKNGYNVAGSKITYCNGTNWDRVIGKCRVNINITTITTKSNRFCDFETKDLCGWHQDDFDYSEWKRTTGVNIHKKIKTGPQFDHTTMEPYNGHFMFVESINKLPISYARLISPIYSKDLSINSCINFWYHMYGTTVRTLKIYIKPLSLNMSFVDESHIYWEKRHNQGNFWHQATFNMNELTEDFQIIIEGSTGGGHLSDIAIDDVSLLIGKECLVIGMETTTDILTSINPGDYKNYYETTTIINDLNEHNLNKEDDEQKPDNTSENSAATDKKLIREMETLTELKELRLRVMELETQVQVSTNQLRRQDEENKKLREELDLAKACEKDLANKTREQQHRYSDLESRMKDENTQQSQIVAELKQEISRLKTKNSEMLAEGELRSNSKLHITYNK